MKMKDNVLVQLKAIASKYKIDKMLLFGSRARGEHSPVSDYDVAVFERELSQRDRALLCLDIEEINTLKKIDVVFIDDNIEEEFIANITKEGVVIYEQARE